MKKFLIGISAIILLLIFISCDCQSKKDKNCCTPKTTTGLEIQHVLIDSILTKEEQAKLTPDRVIDILKKGNEEFMKDELTIRNNSQRVREAASGQYPKAAIVSCLDSRVPVEDIFHRGIGDVFVARLAGNIINEDVLGSLEYACKVSGSKLVVVLGHEYCGAVKSAIDNVELGNITGLLNKIKPAVASAKKDFEGEATSKNPEFVEKVCEHNVDHAIDEIRKKSSILKEMESKGEIKIVGAIYDLDSGKVEFID